jgi:hypothetical protein
MKVFHDTPKHAHMQGLFSLGDRRVFSALMRMAHTDDYAAACRDAGIDPAFYIFREKRPDETLPWDFISAGAGKQRLRAEYQTALEDAGSLPPAS